MFKLNPSKLQLKQPSKFDIPGFATKEKRKQILQQKMLTGKFMVKGGTSQNNPYKDIQDVILAEKREVAEYYKKSILWSPKYTPWHFKNLFLYPALGVALLMFYIRYIAVPRTMKKLKAKGYNFPDLEEKGWMDGWMDDDEEDVEFYEMGEFEELTEFEKTIRGKDKPEFQDWTMKDLYNFEKKDKNNLEEQAKSTKEKRIEEKRSKMQNKLSEFYNYRQSKLETEE